MWPVVGVLLLLAHSKAGKDLRRILRSRGLGYVERATSGSVPSRLVAALDELPEVLRQLTAM